MKYALSMIFLFVLVPCAKAQPPTPTEKAILAELAKINGKLDGLDARLKIVEAKQASPPIFNFAAPAPPPPPPAPSILLVPVPYPYYPYGYRYPPYYWPY